MIYFRWTTIRCCNETAMQERQLCALSHAAIAEYPTALRTVLSLSKQLSGHDQAEPTCQCTANNHGDRVQRGEIRCAFAVHTAALACPRKPFIMTAAAWYHGDTFSADPTSDC